ncbi:MAG: AI-2E family transporter, partial [Clostridia bacterium]|nr:AI-2E family transporter [Clostridia bacterium]
MDGNKTINKKHKIAFLVYIVAILAILCAANAAAINDFLKGILHIFRPVINGLVIAYLCNPIFRFFERSALSFVRAPRLRRMLSLLLSYLTLALVVALLLLLILPQIFDRIIQLATQFDAYVSAAIHQFNNAIDSI